MQNVKIILVNPSHAGNIGAVARAMKAMELSNLTLVNPKNFPHVDATARAAGADDILANAHIASSLAEAIKECVLVIGTSVRTREISLPLLDPKAAVGKIIATTQSAQKAAIVFGRENNGLHNEELQLCHYQLNIPTNPEFSSLNLAAAVQIITYEIKQAASNISSTIPTIGTLASCEEIELFYKHLEKVLIEINFIDPKRPRQLMPRLRRLFNRAQLEKLEINILRGILTAILQKPIHRSEN